MKVLLSFALVFVFISNIKAQQLTFEYDEAGNQKVRQWICVNCPLITTTNPANQDENNLLKKSFGDKKEENLASHKLSVYPNPLTEVLNVKWWNDDKIYVKYIEVFSLSGVRLFLESYTDKQSDTSISFINLAAGSYLLKANYSNNKQEVIKLIKQ